MCRRRLLSVRSVLGENTKNRIGEGGAEIGVRPAGVPLNFELGTESLKWPLPFFQGNSLIREEVKHGQLMTSVSAPVFDRRNSSVRADLPQFKKN